MNTAHDKRARRCPRLGHQVEFVYCRAEDGGRLCGRILDCWWEQFDVRAFLEAQAPDELAALPADRVPAAKVATIADLIKQAQVRAADG